MNDIEPTDLPAHATLGPDGTLSLIQLPNASDEQRRMIAGLHPGGQWFEHLPGVFIMRYGGERWTVTSRGPLAWSTISYEVPDVIG